MPGDGQSLNGAGDFIIESGTLKKYKGPGGDVTVPERLTEPGSDAFCGCGRLRPQVTEKTDR